MKILLTTVAKEDIAALRQLDLTAYHRLCAWLARQEATVCPSPDDIATIHLHLPASLDNINFEIFSWPLSEVHRVVFTRYKNDLILLQCRFHF